MENNLLFILIEVLTFRSSWFSSNLLWFRVHGRHGKDEECRLSKWYFYFAEILRKYIIYFQNWISPLQQSECWRSMWWRLSTRRKKMRWRENRLLDLGNYKRIMNLQICMISTLFNSKCNLSNPTAEQRQLQRLTCKWQNNKILSF